MPEEPDTTTDILAMRLACRELEQYSLLSYFTPENQFFAQRVQKSEAELLEVLLKRKEQREAGQ